MNRTLKITGDDIVQWAARVDAAPALPQLVRRLLLATTALRYLEMRADGGVHLGGWDGVVQADTLTPFSPAGLSVWELSVEDKPRKLNEDFQKRTSDPPSAVELGRTTYVAVTGRRFGSKVDWAAAKKAGSGWADVRVLDADDLAAWLETAPAVACWFASEHLSRPTHGIRDVGSFLEEWQSTTTPPLAPRMLVSGRQDAVAKVRGWFEAPNRALRIVGDTREEALAFVAAVMDSEEREEDRDRWLARSVVVETPDAVRWSNAVSSQIPLILLLRGAAIDPAASGPRIVVPMDPSDSSEDAIKLPRLLRAVMAAALEESGLAPDHARRLAADSGGKVSALRRLLGAVELPPWARDHRRSALMAMLLVGQWVPANAADRAVVEMLGAESSDVEGLCNDLMRSPDPPVERKVDAYAWRSPQDAWRLLAGWLSDGDLHRFETASLELLGATDPRFELKPEERFYAPVRGKMLPHSNVIREGLAESLVRLALSDSVLSTTFGVPRGSRLACSILHKLLRSDWQTWASLSDVLPVLAEACPEVFLDRLEASLRETEGVARLLRQEAQIGSSPHVGLLWAIEKLAWSDDLVNRVVEALAELSDRDWDNPNARMANRPIASLRNVLHPIMPQSCTTVAQRLVLLERLLERFPRVGWSLNLSMTNQMEMFLESQRPQWPEWVPGSLPAKGSQCSGEERRKQVTESVGLLLRHAGKSAARWADLVQLASQNHEFRDRILDALVVQFPSELDTDGTVRAALRSAASLHLPREGEGTEERQEDWKRFFYAYDSYTPHDPVRRVAWLFAPMVDLPDIPRDYHAEEEERAKRRTRAVEAVLDSEEGWKKLEALAGVVESPVLIGEALAASRFAEAAEQRLMRDAVEPLDRVLPRLLAARQAEKGMGWFEETLAGLLLNERLTEAAEAALFVTGVDRGVLWDMIDRLGNSLRQEYWQRFVPYGRYAIAEAERAIRELLHVEREADAVVVADQREDRLPDETVLLVLERLQEAIEGEKSLAVRNAMLNYHVGRLCAQLDRSTSVDATRVARLELFFLLAMGEQTPSSRLFLLLEESAEEFVELVTNLYRAAGEAMNDAPEAQNRAKAAYRILEAWKGYPGRSANPEEVQAKVESWARDALVRLKERDRARGGAHEVARVLARAPIGSDGIWPGSAARKLLESDEFPDLSEELVHAQFNRRGVVTRRVAEGGAQERELAARYRAWFRETRSEWPRTSRVLATLADAYERMAEDEDVRAVVLRREFDEPDAPAPGRTSLLADHRERSVRAEDASEKVDQILSLRIGNLRCIEKLELGLGGLAVLIGENGSGKSSILEACEILRRATTDEFLRELQSIHGGLQGLLRRGANVLKLGVTIGHSEQPDRQLDYDIHLAPTGDGAPVIITERVVRSKTGEVIAQGQGSVRRRVTAPGDHVGRVLDALKNIEVHLPFEVTAMWAARAHKRESVIRNATPVVVPKRCEVFGSNLVSVYHHLRQDTARWPDTREFLRLGLGNDLEDVLTTVDASGNSMALAVKWRGQDAPVPAFALADGILSYLGFVAILRLPQPKRSLLAFDEPDLHLHPQLVARVLHLLEEESESTTVLLATQSDHLLDALSDPVQSTRVCELCGKERVTVVRELDKDALDAWLQDYRGLGDLRAAGYLDAALGQADEP